ncbi:Rha family transcriptional regulator [Eubacterium callanderi]|uniref:Rha family transcriptional regulator n=1 Tax=Eubacterium callanderi TaxID=53442 RepID=UPI001D07D561|nr:Rha family transcriptional regulator [Eubacterium callanderi]MCB6754613.1 Rha family transcriptional regulator [Eubacterium callanderi]MCB7106239.1 Rha family transcriptional regulator [Eubacterium callanderi]MCG4821590.1 Rha family transcriptional regulator [Eubacterium callanderi]MCQ5191958.1 Rha family transcriptional regulator [Eubacterium callanderi]
MNNKVNIKNLNGTTVVSSRQIAEDFEKEHKKVIRDIENLMEKTSGQNWTDLFIRTTYKDSYGREQKEYLCTRDAFALLGMGFTGEKAIQWKLKYIEAFNLMEAEMRKVPLTDRPGEIAKLINALSSVMQRNDSAPVDVARNTQLICEQYGIRLIDGFVRVPNYEQIGLLQG